MNGAVRCRWCGASIIWARMHPSGRPMPLTAESAERRVVWRPDGDGRAEIVETWRAHWADCPGAAEARARARGENRG